MIPGHRGDRDVDELIMFIDGHSSKGVDSQENGKTKVQQNCSEPVGPSVRRKSRRNRKNLEEKNGEEEKVEENENEIKISSPEDKSSTNVEKVSPKTFLSPTKTESESLSNSLNENVVEPFFTVVHRRRSTKDRRNEQNSTRPTTNNVDKRKAKIVFNSTTRNNSISSKNDFQPSNNDQKDKTKFEPNSSSVGSTKNNGKTAPVVFLNKSAEVQLNDVSFGFDLENSNESTSVDRSFVSKTRQENLFFSQKSESTNENPSHQEEIHSNNEFRNIHPQEHLFNHQPNLTHVDPVSLYQFNQQRLAASFSQQPHFLNLVRNPYLTQTAPYLFVPPVYQNESNKTRTIEQSNDENKPNLQEPLIVYTAIPNSTAGQIYFQPMLNSGKNLNEFEHPPVIPQTTMYSQSNFYPSPLFYSNFLPNHPAYFQPIPSSSTFKSQFDETEPEDFDDDDDDDDDLYDSRSKNEVSSSSSSAHIMSNALQLVYSHQKKNTPKDQFNLESLTAHLAMKWTDGINRFEQGKQAEHHSSNQSTPFDGLRHH